MLAVPDTYPIDLEPLHSVISLPYTLTPGRAAGVALAEVANHRIVGSRFKASGRVVAPAQDFDPIDGESDPELVQAPETGVLTAFTEIESGIIGLIRLDGCDTDFPHRILDASYDDLKTGVRVTARWGAADPNSFLALAGFTVTPDAPEGSVQPLTDPGEASGSIPYKMELHYDHAYGPYYGRMFDEMKTNARVMGVRTSDGVGALLPPRELDDISHKPTGTWVKCGPEGTVRACSVIYLEFVGQTRPPPYVYAEIVLDGALTRLINTIDGVDMSRVKELVKPGTRVRAVWKEERVGKLSDISHFELLEE